MAETSQQAKVKTPLHLRLTPADWEECCKMLNYAEMKVFIWIRASDPYGVRELKFSCSKLGEKLGLHKSSVSRALKSLDTKRLIEIDFEDVRITQKVSNRRLTLLCKEGNGSEQEQEEENGSVAPTQLMLHPRNAGCTDATPGAPVQRPVRQCNEQPPEPLPQKDFKGSYTSLDFSDFIQTLSEGERENFENYCERRASQEAKKPKAWIRTVWRDLWDDFQEHEAKRKANEASIEASKAEAVRKEPETAANEPSDISKPSAPTADALNQHWQKAKAIGNSKLCKAIETQAHSLGYEVAENGIAGELKDSDQGSSSGRGFKPPE